MSQILEITLENFDCMIMAASKERPVVLHFFSSRYPECATFGALLEKEASLLDFTLGTVNLDVPENNQFIQVFRVQSLPDVRIISGGQIIDAISGIMPEDKLRARLEKHFLSDEKRYLMNVESLIEQKFWDEALPQIESVLKEKPGNKPYLLLKAKALLGQGQVALAKEILESFIASDDEYTSARSYLSLIDFHVEVAKTEIHGEEAQIYHEACLLAVQSEYKKSLQRFLDLVQLNKDWNNGAASKAMLTLFGVLGPKHELTWVFRSKLNTILFI
jgi:putative thioredoxin